MAVFDTVAKSYDSWFATKTGSFIDKVETELAFSLFRAGKNQRILDAGCGTGNFSLKLAELGCLVTGIDISEEMLALAKEKTNKLNQNIVFHLMDICQLSFPDETFDGALSMAAFDFIQTPVKALNEMLRVTKRGGHVLIGTINKESKWGQLYLREDYQRESVFKYADLKTLAGIKSWKRELLVRTGECLFVPPDSKEEDFNPHKERELSRSEKGGYICALWRKT